MNTDEEGGRKKSNRDTGVSPVLEMISTGEMPVSGPSFFLFPHLCPSVPHLWLILFLFSKGNR
jgi:hypothetical protein